MRKMRKRGKRGGWGAAHSIDSRAISAIVREREREQAGEGQGIINCGGDIHQHNTAFLIPNIYPS